jgi:hypothetical protein
MERFENVIRSYFGDKKISEITLDILQSACRYDIDKYIVEMACVLYHRNLSDCNARIHQEIVLNKLCNYNGESDILPMNDRLNFLNSVLNVFGRLPKRIKGVNYEIPDYKSRVSELLQDTLVKVENELGIQCEIHIQPYGVDSQAMISFGNVESRKSIKKIIVTCIDIQFKCLEGEYLSYGDLMAKVDELRKTNKYKRINISKYSINVSGFGMSVCEDVCLIRYVYE